MKTKKGKVILVGAGPGDGELLTLKGWNAIKEADVILHDRLMGADLFAYFPTDAQWIDVGKTAGNHPIPQEQINELLVQHALAGKNVVRLKGGDPFVFGRGAEELALLVEQGIDFQVIPGVPSFIGGSCYGGISITQRGLSSSFHVFTGHGKENTPMSFDFEAMAKMGGTLIFMMALANGKKIAEGLLSAGLSEKTPAAVIENGTLPTQRTFSTTLGQLVETIQIEKIQSPAILLVGDVCENRESLDWFSALPLRGKRILVTRPEETAGTLGQKLTALGAQVQMYPCIQRTPLSFEIDLQAYATLVFTSAYGVKRFFEKLWDYGKDSRSLSGQQICVVGSETAQELEKYGIRADLIPETYDGGHLAQEILSKQLHRNGKIGVFRAKEGATALTDLLAEAGADYDDTPVYQTQPMPLKALSQEKWDMVTFTSASCVDAFIKANSTLDFKAIRCICIGDKTRAAAAQVPMQTIVADKATIHHMVEKILEVL